MTEAEDEAHARLNFQLDVQQGGFWFGLVVGPDRRTRARLRELAQQRCTELGLAFHHHRGDVEALGMLAGRLAQAPPAGLHWIATEGGLEDAGAWESATGKLLLALNERRDVYRKHMNGGLVLEGSEGLKHLVRTLAPDLFSIRSFILEPGAEAAEPWAPMMLQRMSEPVNDEDLALEIERAVRLRAEVGPGALQPRLESLLRVVEMLVNGRRFEELPPWIDEAEGLMLQTSKGSQPEAWTQEAAIRLDTCRAEILLGSRRYPEARQLGEATLKRSIQQLGWEHQRSVEVAYGVLAPLHWNINNYAAIQTLVRHFSQTQEQVPLSERILKVHFLRALSSWITDDYPQMENELRFILDGLHRSERPNRDLHVSTMNFLGMVLWHQARPAEAIPVLRECLKQQQRLNSPAADVSVTLKVISECYGALGLEKDAEQALKEAIQLAKGSMEESDRESDIADLYFSVKRFSQAGEHFKRSLRLIEDRCGLDSPATLLPLLKLSRFLYATHRFDESKSLLNEALVLIDAGKSIPAAIPVLRDVHKMLVQFKHGDDAQRVEAAIHRIAPLAQKAPPPDPPAPRKKKRR